MFLLEEREKDYAGYCLNVKCYRGELCEEVKTLKARAAIRNLPQPTIFHRKICSTRKWIIDVRKGLHGEVRLLPEDPFKLACECPMPPETWNGDDKEEDLATKPNNNLGITQVVWFCSHCTETDEHWKNLTKWNAGWVQEVPEEVI
jgi:hypothetical protein